MTNLFGTRSPYYNQRSYPKVSCPHHPVRNTNRDQRPLFFPISFSVSFGLFLFHFKLNFILEFKWSMSCTNININIYSFTHIKCNTKVNYMQSATQKSITYKVQQKIYLILSYLLLLSMFDTPS